MGSEVHFCEGMRSSLDDLVPLEAIIDEEVGKSMIKVRPQSHQAVSFIRVTDLSEENILLLQSSAEHHGLLIVNIVICCAVNHQKLFISKLLSKSIDITSLITRQVVISGWETKISRRKDVKIHLKVRELTSLHRYCHSRSS